MSAGPPGEDAPPPYALQEAEAALAAADVRMGAFVRAFGPCTLAVRPAEPFEALLRSVVYQQLSGKAAGAIYGRLLTRAGNPPRPEALAALAPEELRACGLSRAKAAAAHDLAARALEGRLPSRAALAALPDDEVVRVLSAARGVGPWTAQMVMLFTLGRPDVWPVTDLGVQEGYRLLYGLPERPGPAMLAPLGERFRPWRSVAAWYLWRVVDAHRADPSMFMQS